MSSTVFKSELCFLFYVGSDEFNSHVITLFKQNDYQRQGKSYVCTYAGNEAYKILTTTHTRTSLFVVLIGCV